MFFLTLIICQTVFASAKVLHYELDRDFESDNRLPVVKTTVRPSDVLMETWDDPLWIIKFDDFLNITHLRTSSIPEEEYFDATFGPKLHRFPLQYLKYKQQQQASRREKKDDPNKSYSSEKFYGRIQKRTEVKNVSFTERQNEKDNNEVKYKIIQMINKFVLSLKDEPDTNLPEELGVYHQPVLTLFFKGPFTVLVVNYERMEWHFIILQPSPLPKWFYKEHSDRTINKYGMYVEIPAAVKEEFFAKLLGLLTRLFGYSL